MVAIVVFTFGLIEAASALLATVNPFRQSVRLPEVTLSSLTNDLDADEEGQQQLDLVL